MPNRLDIQGIETLAVKSKNNSDTAVVLLHGYGASMHDLFPLWQLWNEGDYNWYFPNGIQSLQMGYYEGRAWFPIDISRLEQSLRDGTSHRDLVKIVPPGFTEVINQLEKFVRELANSHKQIILGGFSQGAMCASHLAVEKDLPLTGLILLSGSLVASEKFPKSARALPFYQSHGTNDPVLPIEGAKLLEEKLLSLNFKGKLESFRGGHEIPPKVIEGVKRFLSDLPAS